MNRRTTILTLCASGLSLGSPAFAQDTPGALADARPGDVRLFVSNAMRNSLTLVQPQLEALLSRRLVMQFGESREMQNAIMAGQPFEVAMMISPVIDAMIAKGKIVAGSNVSLGLERIGVGVRGDIPALDIKSAAGIKAMLQGATRISRVYGQGASVETADRLFDKLDIGTALNGKILRRGGGSQSKPPPLQSGQYEINIDTHRVIAQMKGWTDLGLLPEEYQVPVILAAGIGAAGDRDAAARLIAFLKTPAFDQALSDNDITRR